jgi:hypothetical protein
MRLASFFAKHVPFIMSLAICATTVFAEGDPACRLLAAIDAPPDLVHHMNVMLQLSLPKTPSVSVRARRDGWAMPEVRPRQHTGVHRLIRSPVNLYQRHGCVDKRRRADRAANGRNANGNQPRQPSELVAVTRGNRAGYENGLALRIVRRRGVRIDDAGRRPLGSPRCAHRLDP